MIRTLQRIKDRNPEIRWDRAEVKGEIEREAELYRKISRLQKFYLHSSAKKQEFLEVALSAISDESLERIFRCLGLLYPAEGLRIIYERLLEHRTPEAIRSHAIDLLQNLLGPEFYALVQGLFDERALEGVKEEEAVSLLEELVVSPDRWLSLIANFVVIELGLHARWPGLASRTSFRSFESLDV